jgi:hypothetical protein
MSLRPGESPGRAIAVFPFLKTTEPIRLGSFTFRSTDDITDLREQDAVHIQEIAAMLFLKDDLRIRSVWQFQPGAGYDVSPQAGRSRRENRGFAAGVTGRMAPRTRLPGPI